MNKRKNCKEKKLGQITSFFVIFLIMLFILNNVVNAQSKTWSSPKAANEINNPLAGNTETLKSAQVIYTSYCAPCHGNKGKGDGIASAGLAIKPADHTSDIVQKQTDGALYWMISQGRSPMPSYKTVLTDNQRWEIVNYIRTLAKNKK